MTYRVKDIQVITITIITILLSIVNDVVNGIQSVPRITKYIHLSKLEVSLCKISTPLTLSYSLNTSSVSVICLPKSYHREFVNFFFFQFLNIILL